MVGRLKLDTADSVHEIAGGHIDDVEHITEENACSANHSADLGIPLQHKHPQAESGGDAGETETGKTGTHDNHIIDIPLLVR
jgi:hypothetical protein